MVVGSAIRCIPFKLDVFTWWDLLTTLNAKTQLTNFPRMCHLCAILNGVAGIIVFSAPSALSSTWFPPEERTTATGVAIVFNNLGNAFSFLLAPAIVPDPSFKNDTADLFR